MNETKDVICMERKQGKKLISLTQAENKELSMIDCGKLINENIRMLKECQTQEEMMRLLKTANKYTLYMIHARLGLGFPIWERERTKDFYIGAISEYIVNGCVDTEAEAPLKIRCFTFINACQFMKETYDRECGTI